MTTATQQIELPAFSGPLDLLLHLIERNELDITAISLAKVAEQYLTQIEIIRRQQASSQETIGPLLEFLVIGAQLVLIKSRALLPKSPLETEGGEEEDPAETLARRLREYKRFKEAAAWLNTRIEAGLRTYLRLAPPPKISREPILDMSGMTIDLLQNAMLEALERAEMLEDSVSVVQRPTITIEGQIGKLRRMVSSQTRLPFRELLSNRPSRAELSVSLLATLELVKRFEVAAEQPYPFGPIEIVALPQLGAQPDKPLSFQ